MHVERRIFPKDLQRLGYCHKGARRFLARNGFAWNEFRKQGIPIDEIKATGDAMAIRLAEMIENG